MYIWMHVWHVPVDVDVCGGGHSAVFRGSFLVAIIVDGAYKRIEHGNDERGASRGHRRVGEACEGSLKRSFRSS